MGRSRDARFAALHPERGRASLAADRCLPRQRGAGRPPAVTHARRSTKVERCAVQRRARVHCRCCTSAACSRALCVRMKFGSSHYRVWCTKRRAAIRFFVIQFIRGLRDDGLLVFDAGSSVWRWDLAAIVARGFTDNLADFMVAKIGRLPGNTREVLKQLACIGRSASLGLLSGLAGQSEARVQRALADAVLAGLIVQSGSNYRFSARSRARGKLRLGHGRRARSDPPACPRALSPRSTRRCGTIRCSRPSITSITRSG